jgi:hypothetical protein
MTEQLWKALVVTPEEEKLVQEIRDSGAGKSLSPEALNLVPPLLIQFSDGIIKTFETASLSKDRHKGEEG